MFQKPVSGLAGIALVLACAVAAHGQDFHVSTRIHDLRAAPQKGVRPPPPQLCESLFNAGKVYDFNDGGSQVTIFEPAQQRFVIIDSANRTSTVVPFDYITQRLHQAHARRTAELTKAPKNSAELLESELNPRFQEKFDKQKRLLVLDSPFVKYEVHCDPAESPELLERYLNYADWAYRLNYASYRTGFLPGPRLEVNKRLRHWGMLPVRVDVRYKFENGPYMRAEHKFIWHLDGDNKAAISHWEKTLTARDVKLVSPDDLFEQPFRQARIGR